jgi:hypothetical protein
VSAVAVTISAKPQTWYYVETIVTHPDGTLSFGVHLMQAINPRYAETMSVVDDRERHPESEIQFYMSRRLTDRKAASVRRHFEAGTWEGWFS